MLQHGYSIAAVPVGASVRISDTWVTNHRISHHSLPRHLLDQAGPASSVSKNRLSKSIKMTQYIAAVDGIRGEYCSDLETDLEANTCVYWAGCS